MGVTLEPERGSASLRCNWWNWRPTARILLAHGLLHGEALEIADATGGDIVTLDAEEALRAADVVDGLLASLEPEGRIRLDGTVTTEPDTFEVFRGPDVDKNYGATRVWLEEFRDFCRRSGGFTAS